MKTGAKCPSFQKGSAIAILHEGFEKRSTFGYQDPTPYDAYYRCGFYPEGSAGLSLCEIDWRIADDVRKNEIIEKVSGTIGVDAKKLYGAWASWSQPSIALMPPADSRVATKNGMYGDYTDMHFLRLAVGYKLAGRESACIITVPSPEAEEISLIIFEEIKAEAMKEYPELTLEQAITKFLLENLLSYRQYTKAQESKRWKYSLKPGMLGKMISLLEAHTVDSVMNNKDTSGNELINLKRMPLSMWQRFLLLFAQTLAEIETGKRYPGANFKQDDILLWTDFTHQDPEWSLRESKIFQRNDC